MKRKLPQWLLDATNNNSKSVKLNSPTSKTADQSINDENVEPIQITKTGSINIVPIANLLSPSRSGTLNNDSSKSVDTSDSNKAKDNETPKSDSISNGDIPVIKTEKIDEVDTSTSNIQGSSSNPQSSTPPQVVIKKEIKEEPADTAAVQTTNPTVNDIKTDIKPIRISCNFGIKCFSTRFRCIVKNCKKESKFETYHRRNPSHRTELAHPGDTDYRRPSLPSAPPGTPACPWGAACYRRNPQHFIQLSHPPSSVYDPTANTTPANVNAMPQPNLPSRRNRQNNRPVVTNADSDEEDDYDLEDPFIDDGSSDEYVPDEDEDDDETETPEDTQEL